MITINDFAFCFFATNQSDIDRQDDELKILSQKYKIERWYRRDRNPFNYLSFSQMVNDAIDDTDSEFMIFCNPKTILKKNDLEFILDKLSNGYCFTSTVSFGLFGFSKELIRHMGMLDERFIGGGWEDNDFAIRLLDFGKACWWGYDKSSYNGYFSKSQNLKHISTSIFQQKYQILIDKKIIIVNEQHFKHKQISPRHKQKNLKIFESWLDSSHNYGNNIFGKYLNQYQILHNKKSKKEILTKFEVKISYINHEFFIEFNSDVNISLNFTVLKNLSHGRTVLLDNFLTQNTWYGSYIPDVSDYFDSVEVRLFIQDNQIYNNTINLGSNLVFDFCIPVLV